MPNLTPRKKFKRLLAVVAAACLILTLAGLATKGKDRPLKQVPAWKTGFWVWMGEKPVPSRTAPEILYVQIEGAKWPAGLPDAQSYVAVRRIDANLALTRPVAASIAADYRLLLQNLTGRTRLVGMQIDYDCPTNRLEDYARFLQQLRKQLPSDTSLSITALLDWFGSGTAIDDVLAPVDEFVPQFYDLGARRPSAGIAAPIDRAKWAAIFNARKTPYRIGISSFGRIARTRHNAAGGTSVQFFRDAGPLDFADRREFRRSVTSTPAGETVVHYDVLSAVATLDLLAGDEIDITFPTEASVRDAYIAARGFGGYCSGVIFFRWPTASETQALTFSEVTQILNGTSLDAPIHLETIDGACLERNCLDLYLYPGRRSNSEATEFRIRSGKAIDLFIPDGSDGPLRTAMIGTQDLAVHVPAYAGARSIYLGRVFTASGTNFEVTRE